MLDVELILFHQIFILPKYFVLQDLSCMSRNINVAVRLSFVRRLLLKCRNQNPTCD